MDIGGVAEDAELDALSKPVLVDRDTAEVGAGLYVGAALVDGTGRRGGHYGALEVGLDLAVFVDEGGVKGEGAVKPMGHGDEGYDPFRLT